MSHSNLGVTVLGGVALLGGLVGTNVQAAYPEKPITIVVSAAPGGSPDILARLIGRHLADKVGQPVHIENKPGGAGNIASSYVARARPDGYTLYVATDVVAINQTLFKERGYDAVNSFTPIVQAIEAPQIFAVRPGVPADTLGAFIDIAKKAPGKYALASPAIGTTGQLGVLMLQNQASIEVNPVVYRSAQPALTDVLGNHADGIIVTLAPALPYIKENRLKPIAVSTRQRTAVLPDVPTFVEQGLPRFEFGSWQGFVAPAGTPSDVIATLNTAINDILADPAVRKSLEEQAFDVIGGQADAFAKVISDSIRSWAEVIRENDLEGKS